MNFYFIERVFKEDRASVLNALRNVMQSMYRGFSVKPVLHNASTEEDQLFLEVPNSLLWGRILFEPFSLPVFKSLCDEWDDWVQITGERVMLYIFFPRVTDGVFDSLNISSEDKKYLLDQEGIRFFEYFFLAPDGNDGIALREWNLQDLMKKMPSLKRIPCETKDLNGYRFFKEASLTREELSEFLDFGVELERLSLTP